METIPLKFWRVNLNGSPMKPSIGVRRDYFESFDEALADVIYYSGLFKGMKKKDKEAAKEKLTKYGWYRNEDKQYTIRIFEVHAHYAVLTFGDNRYLVHYEREESSAVPDEINVFLEKKQIESVLDKVWGNGEDAVKEAMKKLGITEYEILPCSFAAVAMPTTTPYYC